MSFKENLSGPTAMVSGTAMSLSGELLIGRIGLAITIAGFAWTIYKDKQRQKEFERHNRAIEKIALKGGIALIDKTETLN